MQIIKQNTFEKAKKQIQESIENFAKKQKFSKKNFEKVNNSKFSKEKEIILIKKSSKQQKVYLNFCCLTLCL